MVKAPGDRRETLRRRVAAAVVGLAVGVVALYSGSALVPQGRGGTEDPPSQALIFAAAGVGGQRSARVAPPAVVAVWQAVNMGDGGADDGFYGYDYLGYQRTGDRLIVRFGDGGEGIGRVVVDTSAPDPEIVATRGIDLQVELQALIPLLGSPDRIVVGGTWVTPTRDGVLTGFDFFWTGGVPSVEAVVCGVDLYDPKGVHLVHRDVPLAGPIAEGARDGIVETSFPRSDFPRLPAMATDAKVTCRNWQGEGFKLVAPVALQRSVPREGMPAPFGDDTAYIVGALAWVGDPSVQIWRCDVAVREADGDVIVRPTTLFAGPPLGQTGLPTSAKEPTSIPLEGVLRVPGDLSDVAADVACVPTNELDPALP